MITTSRLLYILRRNYGPFCFDSRGLSDSEDDDFALLLRIKMLIMDNDPQNKEWKEAMFIRWDTRHPWPHPMKLEDGKAVVYDPHFNLLAIWTGERWLRTRAPQSTQMLQSA